MSGRTSLRNSPLARYIFTVLVAACVLPTTAMMLFTWLGIHNTLLNCGDDTKIVTGILDALWLTQMMFMLLIISVTLLLITYFMIKKIKPFIEQLSVIKSAFNDIANKNFQSQLTYDTHDEFSLFAQTFNRMNQQLHAQFTALETMAYIDRMILSTLSAHEIAEVILTKMHRIMPCDQVGFLLQQDGKKKGTLYFKSLPHGKTEKESFMIKKNQLSHFLETKEPKVVARKESFFINSKEFGEKYDYHLIFPVFVENHFSGAILLAYQKEPIIDPHHLMTGKDVAQRVAVALSNVVWEEKLYQKAHFDALTLLPNRLLFQDRLKQALLHADRDQTIVALLYIDLDKFKFINDTLGHAYGDLFLQETAARLTGVVREMDTVSRIGGDEFTVVIPDLLYDGDIRINVANVAEKIRTVIQQPYHLNNETIFSSASIGIALYPKDANEQSTLMKHADCAMYHAKTNGKNAYEFYSKKLNQVISDALKLENRLHKALQDNEFCLYFQPYFDIESQKILGAEALVRWVHPEKGVMMPDEFLPVMEKSELITQIGQWTLIQACQELKKWHQAGFTDLRISVNLSACQIQHTQIMDVVVSALVCSHINPNKLEIEITENSLLQDIQKIMSLLTKLSAVGVRISIDDFGTGYSSLSYLKQLPVDTLKIDKSFISDLTHDRENRAIISTIINLGHELDMEIIAEGVENEDDLNVLREAGCNTVQGYLYSHPIPSEQFISFLERTRSPEIQDPNLMRVGSIEHAPVQNDDN